MLKAPLASLNFAPAGVEIQNLEDGSMILRSTQKLQEYPQSLGRVLRYWAEKTPEQVFLAERDQTGGWRTVTYSETASIADAVSQALLDRGFLGDDFKAKSMVMVLSDNGVDSALIQLGAMQIGVPAVPVSPAYSLMSKDHARLKYISDLIAPALIYVVDGQKFKPALSALALPQTELVCSRNPAAGLSMTSFSDLIANTVSSSVDEAFEKVGPESIAKILFTSGSTGLPKGVINTQGMLCSNQQAIQQLWPFLEEKPPVILDWLPWSHTFGSNHNFNIMMYNGGTLYIDFGKPAPGLIEQTVANLKEISPTLYFNVPRGIEMLLPFMEKDDELRDKFFRNLDIIFYAAAALPQNLYEKLENLSIQARGERVNLVSAWGSTETSPMVTSVHFPIDRASIIGLPAPGCELKMVPNNGKLEMRVKGPNIMPGYWKAEELSREAFDDEGYFCMGDAGKFADPDDPNKGLEFDGRISENFKLMSGTWVRTGNLRVSVIEACAPIIQDAVITGHGKNEIGLLIFPSLPGCKSLCSNAGDDSQLSELIHRPEVQSRLIECLHAYNKAHSNSSARIARALLMTELPNIDANEITDKGYINQRAVLERRANLVEKLYLAVGTAPDVIVL
ncbi:MAG: feruloyl-CoA synthase [SAR324 cluster bacterium]|nr:feruloyl-CoA synthase [SAR324 cluster bacterium]